MNLFFEYFNIMNYIGHIHLLLAIIKNTYGYFFPAFVLFDAIYLILFALFPLSWLCCKGECIISYISKKYKNKDYQLGDQPHDHTDVSDLFRSNNILYHSYSHISTIIYIGSLIIVNNRSKIISNYLLYITIFLLLIYLINNDLRINIYFQIVLAIFLLSVIYNSYLRLYDL